MLDNKKENGLKFEVEYDTLLKSENIASLTVPINPCNIAQKGTKIIIELEEYSAESLLNYLSLMENSQKIIYSFEDESFEIILNINGKVYKSNNRIPLNKINPEEKLYYVTYKSKEQTINYYCNGFLIIQKEFPCQGNDYEIDLEIAIYQLKPYGKSKFMPLFFNQGNFYVSEESASRIFYPQTFKFLLLL